MVNNQNDPRTTKPSGNANQRDNFHGRVSGENHEYLL